MKTQEMPNSTKTVNWLNYLGKLVTAAWSGKLVRASVIFGIRVMPL